MVITKAIVDKRFGKSSLRANKERAKEEKNSPLIRKFLYPLECGELIFLRFFYHVY